MNKFGVERTPLAQNSKMVQKLDHLKFWDPDMKSKACAILRAHLNCLAHYITQYRE